MGKDNKLMIAKNNLYFRFLLWLERVNTQINEPTNQNSSNVPKVVKPTRKRYKNLWGLV